jgi:hypothetical protein
VLPVPVPPPSPPVAETETETGTETETETETASVTAAAPAAAAAASAAATTVAAATAAAPTPASDAPPAPALRVHSDRPYSRLDGLFRPTLHTFALITPAVGTTELGLALSGGDRLDLVRWAVAGYIDPQDTSKISGAGGLILNDLAPWVISVLGQRLHYNEDIRDDDNMVIATLERELRDASLAIGRTFRGTYSLAAGATYAYDRVDDDILRLYGPAAALGYTAIEATRAAGIRRGIAVAVDGAYFPRPAGALTDARGELDVWLPVPLVRRAGLALAGRGHTILDAPAPLILVGGPSALPTVWSEPDDIPDPDVGADVLPGQHRFTEPMRGFEDYGFAARSVALVDATLRYPIMLDAGVPNLGFLPSIFVRELELEVFAGGFYMRPGATLTDRRHAAAGAAITLHLALFRVPLAIRYQLTRRLTDDHGVLHLVGFGPDL